MNPEHLRPRSGRGAPLRWLGLLGLLAFPTLEAHPHNWIDVRVEVRFDQTGRVSELRQRWLFDDYYSVFVTEGMDGDGDGSPDREALDALRDVILGNLCAHRYFTLVEQGDRQAAFGPPTERAVEMRGHRLELTFRLPLAQPLDPGREAVHYRLFDPTYYIEMVHAEADDAITLNSAPEGCRYRMEEPDPDPKMVAHAASLDAGVKGGTGLGIHFAQQVTIQCPAQS